MIRPFARIGGSRARELLYLALVTTASLGACFAGIRIARERGVVPYFYQRYYEPAIRVACGQAFGVDRAREPSNEMAAFLKLERDTLSCEAVPKPLSPDPNPPTRIWYHLFVSVAFVWRVTGISWAAIDAIAAVMLSVSALCVYGIFRLWMPAAIAAGLALVSIVPGLRFLLYLRDVGKAPFILASLLVVAWLVSRELSRPRYFAAMLGIGLLLGTGYGFRPDVAIGLPLLAVTATLFRPEPLRRSWLPGVAGTLLMAGAFLLAARPVFSAFSSNVGSCHWHFSLLGLSQDNTRQLGLPIGSVSWLSHFDDLVLWRSVESYAERALASPPVGFCTPMYDQASKAIYLETLATFPGDFLARALAAAGQVIGFGFWGLSLGSLAGSPRHFMDAVSTLLWLIVILSLLARNLRLGIFACFALAYLCAYPIVQFHPRHYFHLAFLAWLPVGIGLGLLARERHALRAALEAHAFGRFVASRERPSPAAWIRALATLATLVALATAVFVVASAYQERRAGALFERYLAAPGETATVVESVEADGRLRIAYAPVSPAEREVAGRMLRLDVGGPGCADGAHELQLTLRGPEPGEQFRHDYRVEPTPGRTAAIFAPVYFQRSRLDRIELELSANDKPCLSGAKWLDPAALPPLWVGATLGAGERAAAPGTKGP